MLKIPDNQDLITSSPETHEWQLAKAAAMVHDLADLLKKMNRADAAKLRARLEQLAEDGPVPDSSRE